VAVFNMDVRDLQATVTAGSCSSRVIFNVPKARSRGLEAELAVAPSRSSDLRSSLTSTSSTGAVSIVSGIEEGNRLPTVPEIQIVASATYQRQIGTGL